MFEDKILIAVGDSFVYGHLGDDMEVDSCHARSWVSKLGTLGNFKSVVNLAAPGGSNDRSFRTIMEYLDTNYDANNKYLVIYAASEIARFEFPMLRKDAVHYGLVTPAYNMEDIDPELENVTYNLAQIGPWVVDRLLAGEFEHNRRLGEFLKMYYGLFVHNYQEELKLSNQLFCLKSVFDTLNIEYYFTETILPPETLQRFRFLNQQLPTIEYRIGSSVYGVSKFLTLYHHKEHPCGHFDDNANKFLAEYIYKYILADKGKKNAI
jgi:hypothetical protein